MRLIEGIPDLEVNISNNSLRELKDCYNSLINTHSCDDLIHLIKMVYVKKNNAISVGKKLGQTDQAYVKVAEDILYGEFAVALQMPKENIKEFIENKILEIEKNKNLQS